MPNARQLVASRCPECSAPVDLKQVPAAVAQIRCAYCGTHLHLPKRATPASEPPAYRPPVRLPRGRVPEIITPPPPPRTGNAGCGIVAALLIFGVMLLADVNVVRTLQSALENGGARPAELFRQLGITLPQNLGIGHLYGPPIPVAAGAPIPTAPIAASANSTPANSIPANSTPESSRPGNGAGVLIQARDQEDAGLILFFDTQTQSLRWRSGPFSRHFTEIVMTSGPRYIYVADQGRLHALDRDSGLQVWQISLSNPIAMPCTDCLQYMAGYVVALTRDGTLQAFAAESGLPAWNRRLHTTPNRLHNVGGQPAVVDAETNNRATFYMLDRITGAELHAIHPVCQTADRETFASAFAPFVVSSDGLRLHVLGSGSDGCAWRYNLVTGAQEWHFADARENRILPFAWSDESFLIRNGVLYTTQRDGTTGVLRAVDSQTGATTELLRAEQTELKLETSAGNTLVVIATPTFARNEPAIWGIDAQTGVQRWQAQLEMNHAFDTLLVRATPAGLFIGQCLWETDVCLFEMLDPSTGISRGQNRQPVNGSVSGIGYTPDTAWLNIWGKLYAIDLATAQITTTWP
ncbi:MAG: PQQ-binding-like beta-propeller repeat protein [Litorilinea sp.]